MDQDAIWYVGRRRSRRHCVRWRIQLHLKRGTAPTFRPMFIVAKRSPISATGEDLFVIFAISCTKYHVSRPLRSRLTFNDTRRRYFRPNCGDTLRLGDKGRMAHFIPAQTFGWQVKLCDSSLTRANLSALEMRIAHIIQRCTNVLFTYLFYLLKRVVVKIATVTRPNC